MPKRLTPIQKVWLSVGSLVLALVVVWAGLKIYAVAALGIRDPAFRHEYELDVLEPEPRIGFVNRANFRDYCFGNVPVQTNERGFRGTQPTPEQKESGLTRIIGIGDSVMWGASVREEDTFMAVLSRRLHERGRHEVINAGVIGYSTLQERQFLEQHIVPLRPDVVLVNFCDNDLITTEDPGNNAPQLLVQHFQNLREGADSVLSAGDGAALQELIRAFISPHARAAFDATPPEIKDLAWKVLVFRPAEQMAELARLNNFRLIYVFIPSRSRETWDLHRVNQLKQTLTGAGVEWIDASDQLLPDKNDLPDLEEPNSGRKPPARLQVLDNILLAKRIAAVQRQNKYVDHVHLSVRGNQIVAEEIFRHLMNTNTPPTAK